MAGAVTGLWSLGDTAQRRLAGLAGLAFAVNTALATYHVGVERHWWASAVCGRDTSEVADIGNLASALSKPAEVECDRPALVWHGLTMAGANIAYSGLLTAAAVMAARNWRRRR